MPACAGMTIVERDWNERTVARGAGRIGNCWRGRGEAARGEPHAGGAAGGAPDPGRRGFRAGPGHRSRGRKRVESGKRVSVGGGFRGRRCLKKKTKENTATE